MAEIIFKSGLRDQFDSFVQYKKGTQRWNRSSEYFLCCFDKFCAENFPTTKSLTEGMLCWCKERDTEHGNSCSFRVSIIREFIRFARKMNWTTLDLPAVPAYKPRDYIPHFFTEEEKTLFFIELDKYIIRIKDYKKEQAMVRTMTVPVMFRLLFSSGMRTNELRLLKRNDVHLESGVVNINDSKGNDRHRVALHKSMWDLLCEYDSAMEKYMPNRTFFFPSDKDLPRQEQWLARIFRVVWARVSSNQSAIPYNFRHNYAITNINNWENIGYEINDKLIFLGRTMGHTKFSSTMHYFHLAPCFATKLKHKGSIPYQDILPSYNNEE